MALTQQEISTVLAEIEVFIQQSPDPNNGEALTPSHLLIDDGLRSLPLESEEGVKDKEAKLGKRKRLLKQTFRQAWSRVYILGLQSET